MAEMTRKDRIVDLLEHYQDAVPGLVHDWGEHEFLTGSSDGGHAQFAAGVWNHPSYRKLEKLRIRLRDEHPRPYWHLAEFYFRCTRKPMAVCEKCGSSVPLERVGEMHKHGQRTHILVARSVRIFSAAVEAIYVELCIRWLEHNWRGREPLSVAEILDELDAKREAA